MSEAAAQTTVADFPGLSGSWVFFRRLLWWGSSFAEPSGCEELQKLCQKWTLLCMVMFTNYDKVAPCTI